LNSQPHQAERQIKSRFLAWQKKNAQRPAASARQRTVGELHSLAGEAEQRRLQREAKERTRKEAADRKKREAYLQTLAADVERCWNEIDQQAERGKAAGYDAALRAVVDLADACALAGKTRAFDKALRSFMARHGNRGALVRRLVDAGLWQK
jgi:flagellar biosynthesis/type III secretory pathway protein FliH